MPLLTTGAGARIIAAASYTAQGVRFDGTNDYLTRGAALTGVTSTKLGLFSFWFKMMGGDGNFHMIIEDIGGGSAGVQLYRGSDNKWYFAGSNAGTKLSMVSTTTYVADNTWHHFMAAYDTGNAVAQMYVDNSDVRAASPTIVNSVIANASATYWCLFNRSGPAFIANMEVADFYWNVQETLDISNSSNRAKFIGGGAPVDLGTDGSVPTGTAPLIYLHGSTASWHTNDGTGGGFTLNGALTDAGTNPP